tara:strand:- start:6882 stop:7040 length:159 start_codon:yes stop_codon:yes gene_type:complete
MVKNLFSTKSLVWVILLLVVLGMVQSMNLKKMVTNGGNGATNGGNGNGNGAS